MAFAGLAVAGTLVWASMAGACSCAREVGPNGEPADGERQALVRGKAFIGRVVSKRRVGGGDRYERVFTYRVRIARSFNVRLPRHIELTSSALGSTCGFEWRLRQRVGAYLYGRPGDWYTGLCSLADPDDLLRDSKPYPRPLRRGRIAALAWGSFSGARLMALDRRGRILGYGVGGGEGKSVCPGSAVVVDTGQDRRYRPLVYTRRISDLRIISVRPAPSYITDVRCLDPSGFSLAIFAGGASFDSERSAPFRLLRMEGRSRRLLRRGRGTFAALSPRFAFTLEGGGERLVATDLGSARSRRLARIPWAGQPSLSPDGTRLALVSNGLPDPPRRNSRLVMVDLNGPTPRMRRRVLSSPFAGGDLVWQDSRHLLRLRYGERPRPIVRYDWRLRERGRFGSWHGGSGAVLANRLLEIAYDRFRSYGLRSERRVGARGLPTASTSAFLPVAGEPRVIATARRPTPRRPVVRRACRPRPYSGGAKR